MTTKDAFDARVQEMDADSLSESEVTAAAMTYERLRTAVAIASSVLNAPSNADVLAVFSELMAEARAANTSG
jgi:hypothetical protein